VRRVVMKSPVHPGAVLREDVLSDLGLGVGEAASRLGISRVTLSRVLKTSGTTSSAINTPILSGGRPRVAKKGATTNKPPLGIPGTLKLMSTAVTAIVTIWVPSSSTPYSFAMNSGATTHDTG